MNLITKFLNLDFKRKSKSKKKLGAISLGREVIPSPKIVINLSGTYEIYPVKENLIGSAISEILRYKQTNRQTDRHISTLYYRCLSICPSFTIWFITLCMTIFSHPPPPPKGASRGPLGGGGRG